MMPVTSRYPPPPTSRHQGLPFTKQLTGIGIRRNPSHFHKMTSDRDRLSALAEAKPERLCLRRHSPAFVYARRATGHNKTLAAASSYFRTSAAGSSVPVRSDQSQRAVAMSAVRLSLVCLVCLVSVVHGRSPAGLLSDVLSGGLSRLWRPWSRQDPSRGPDRTETLRTVSTNPNRLDEDLDFAERRRNFRQVDREFSVFNPEGAGAENRRRGAGQERWGGANQERWGGGRKAGRRHARHPEQQSRGQDRRRRAGPVRQQPIGRREGRRNLHRDDSVRPSPH